jgi:acetyl-CoA acetyltransferase
VIRFVANWYCTDKIEPCSPGESWALRETGWQVSVAGDAPMEIVFGGQDEAVASGASDCVLAFGFEQMQHGAITERWTDRPSPRLTQPIARAWTDSQISRSYGGTTRS